MSNKSYEVGQGKPPKSGQWKKGQSGNPSGKKKVITQPAQPIIDCMVQQLMTPIEANQNGKIVKMPFATAMVTKLFHEFMTAPFGQKLKAIVMFEGLGIFDLHKIIIETETSDDNDGAYTEEMRRLLAIIEGEVFGEKPHGGGRDSKVA